MFLILLALFASANAYSSGAPKSTCVTMLPGHGVDAQTSESPYKVIVTENDGTYMVTIQSPQLTLFKGFLLQARGPEDQAVGNFKPSETSTSVHTIDCSGTADTVTHSKKNAKPSIKIQWFPQNYQGTAVFTATVVQNKTTFWTGIKSAPIEITNDPDPPETSTDDPNTNPTETPPEATRFYEGCDETKACFGAPPDCIQSQNCEAVVAISIIDKQYIFELRAAPAAKWVGVGLSDDTKMGDDSVIECVKDGQNSQLINAYISTTSRNPADVTRNDDQDKINLIGFNDVDGWMYCQIVRQTVTTINGKVYDLENDKYYLLIASGRDVLSDKVEVHNEQNLASSEKKLLSDVSPNKAASKILLRLHGAFMLAAWLGTASIGIILARYYKPVWPGKQMCGKDIWFSWHRILMSLTWCLTITGFILIWVELEAWSEAENPHAILGMITTILCFMQPIGAMFRPHPGTKHRPLFNWLHWGAGNAAHIFGIVAIFFAVTLTKAELPEWLYWILGGFVLFYALMHLILTIISRTANKSTSKEDEHSEVPFSTSRKCLLGLYIILNILIVIALIVIASMAPI